MMMEVLCTWANVGSTCNQTRFFSRLVNVFLLRLIFSLPGVYSDITTSGARLVSGAILGLALCCLFHLPRESAVVEPALSFPLWRLIC